MHDTDNYTKYSQTFTEFILTQSGASKGGLHSVAVFDAESPHDDSSCALFALLDPEFTAPKGELKWRGTDVECINKYH